MVGVDQRKLVVYVQNGTLDKNILLFEHQLENDDDYPSMHSNTHNINKLQITSSNHHPRYIAGGTYDQFRLACFKKTDIRPIERNRTFI